MKASKTNSGYREVTRPLGVTVIVVIYLLLVVYLLFVCIFLGFWGHLFKASQAFITAFVLSIIAIGLERLHQWGWYLAVGGNTVSLILYCATFFKFWVPWLEILTLPYLVWQRAHFGVTKGINKKGLKITFVILMIATIVWAGLFYWTRQEYNNYIQRYYDWLEEQIKKGEYIPLGMPLSYCSWNGGVYICRTVFLLFCAWIVFIALWRTQLETIDETSMLLGTMVTRVFSCRKSSRLISDNFIYNNMFQ